MNFSDQTVILFLKLDGFVFILEYYVVLAFHNPFFIITVKTWPVQQMLSVISKHTLHLYHCHSDCPAPLHAGLDCCLKVRWWRQLLFLLVFTEQGENVPVSPRPYFCRLQRILFGKVFSIFSIDASPSVHGPPSLPQGCFLLSLRPLFVFAQRHSLYSLPFLFSVLTTFPIYGHLNLLGILPELH